MNGYIVAILIAAGLAGFTLFLLYLRKKKKKDNEWKYGAFDRAMKIVRESSPTLTPNGHKVYFERGTDPSVFSLPACDSGAEKTFQKGECAGYPVNRANHRISIVVFNSIPDSNGDPAYKVFIGPTSPYFNSEYDKERGKGLEVDHYILAAGQTVAVGEPYGDVIVVPHHNGKEAHLSTVVEYEMEHVTLAHYDFVKFEATQYHGNGQGHPLISDCVGMAKFTSRPFTGVCGGVTK